MTTLAGYLEILDECALLTALQKYANDEEVDFLVDNTEVGHRNRIPLWMFGLLY